MNNLNRKIRELENNVVDDDIDESTCHVDLTEAPQAERELHYTAQDILQKYQNGNTVSVTQETVLDQSCKLLTTRGFLLFRKMVKAMCFIDDSVYSGVFDMRLMWFLNESVKLGNQTQEMVKLEKENANLDEDSLEEKRISLENTFEDLWTEKSFDAYEREQTLKMFERIQAKINPADPASVTTEQLTQYLMRGEKGNEAT
jgi:hypothetical protein